MIVFDELTARAPARLAVRLISARPRIEALRTRGLQAWRFAMPWLAALAFVFGYLLFASWMENDRLAVDVIMTNHRADSLQAANSTLRATVAELEARKPGTVFYVLEGNNAEDAKAKLARVAMQLASEHFRLQQAAKEPQP